FGNGGVRSTVEGRKYFSLDAESGFVLAGRGKIGSLMGVPIAEAPPDKLFFAGGGGSVRGYGYNNIGVSAAGLTTGGLSLVEASAEARVKVTGKIGVVGIIDAANGGDSSTPEVFGPSRATDDGGCRSFYWRG